MSAEIVIVQPEEREILRNIYQFYLHDLSEFRTDIPTFL